MKKLKQTFAAVILSVLTATSYTLPVVAAQASSTNYGVTEVQFGSGGELHACSTTYCSKQSAGELTVGNTASTNYQAQAGFNNNREPFLEVINPGGLIDLGNLDPTTVASGSTTFSVKSYLASGYNVILSGSAPKSVGGYSLNSSAVASVSTPGIEQFGVNLMSNSSPVIGADIVNTIAGITGTATASNGYGVANSFKYLSGSTIAASASSSSTSNFTLSVIANIGTATPSGKYAGVIDLIVVPTF